MATDNDLDLPYHGSQGLIGYPHGTSVNTPKSMTYWMSIYSGDDAVPSTRPSRE